MKQQESKTNVKPNSTTAAATKPASRKKGPMKQNGSEARKNIRGEHCTFAGGKHFTIEHAKLIAGKVGELAKMTDDKTDIMNGLKPFAKEHNIALSRCCTGVKQCGSPNTSENKYIHKRSDKGFGVHKVIRGKYCTFAGGKHLTIEQAKLIAGEVGELSKMTNDKTESPRWQKKSPYKDIPYRISKDIAYCISGRHGVFVHIDLFREA